MSDSQVGRDMQRTMWRVIATIFVIGFLFAILGCGGGAAVKTVNVDRVTTNTVAIPKVVACVKRAELLPVPVRTPVDAEGATTDQLAAAAAADREAFMRYADAVASILAQCSE